jgi:hypothetical protein
MNDDRSTGIARDSPRKPRRSHQGWPIGALIIGVLLLARLVAPSIPGLVFKDSIDHVQSICSSVLGALAQAADASVVHGCANASTAMTVLNVAAVAGVMLLIAGGWTCF